MAMRCAKQRNRQAARRVRREAFRGRFPSGRVVIGKLTWMNDNVAAVVTGKPEERRGARDARMPVERTLPLPPRRPKNSGVSLTLNGREFSISRSPANG